MRALKFATGALYSAAMGMFTLVCIRLNPPLIVAEMPAAAVACILRWLLLLDISVRVAYMCIYRCGVELRSAIRGALLRQQSISAEVLQWQWLNEEEALTSSFA